MKSHEITWQQLTAPVKPPGWEMPCKSIITCNSNNCFHLETPSCPRISRGQVFLSLTTKCKELKYKSEEGVANRSCTTSLPAALHTLKLCWRASIAYPKRELSQDCSHAQVEEAAKMKGENNYLLSSAELQLLREVSTGESQSKLPLESTSSCQASLCHQGEPLQLIRVMPVWHRQSWAWQPEFAQRARNKEHFHRQLPGWSLC